MIFFIQKICLILRTVLLLYLKLTLMVTKNKFLGFYLGILLLPFSFSIHGMNFVKNLFGCKSRNSSQVVTDMNEMAVFDLDELWEDNDDGVLQVRKSPADERKNISNISALLNSVENSGLLSVSPSSLYEAIDPAPSVSCPQENKNNSLIPLEKEESRSQERKKVVDLSSGKKPQNSINKLVPIPMDKADLLGQDKKEERGKNKDEIGSIRRPDKVEAIEFSKEDKAYRRRIQNYIKNVRRLHPHSEKEDKSKALSSEKDNRIGKSPIRKDVVDKRDMTEGAKLQNVDSIVSIKRPDQVGSIEPSEKGYSRLLLCALGGGLIGKILLTNTPFQLLIQYVLVFQQLYLGANSFALIYSLAIIFGPILPFVNSSIITVLLSSVTYVKCFGLRNILAEKVALFISSINACSIPHVPSVLDRVEGRGSSVCPECHTEFYF